MDIKPDKDCNECGGFGFLFKDGRKKGCSCVLKNRVRAYLGSTYLGVPYSTKINFTAKQRFCRYDNISKDYFKSLVKSYLIRNAMELTHNSVTPYIVVENYFDNHINTLYRELYSVDFLSIYFTDDLPNKLYGELFYSIFESRILNNKETWLHSWVKFDNTQFTDKYSRKLSEYIIKNFSHTPNEKLKDIKFNKGFKV